MMAIRLDEPVRELKRWHCWYVIGVIWYRASERRFTMAYLISTIAIGCVAWAVVAGLLAVRYCERRGISANPVMLSMELLKCLSQYRKLTREDTGQVGTLFYHYLIPINAALVLFIILLVAKP
jgi:hypothetical protein